MTNYSQSAVPKPLVSDLTLDSSALLAVIGMEPGSGAVVELMSSGQPVMSTVNLAEVATKLIERGLTLAEIQGEIMGFEITFQPFDDGDALATANLRATTRSAGLSLGDRACIALAARLGTPVVTADQAWASVDLPVEVILVR